MTTRITIIGGGPGGYSAAIRAAQMGATVTLVEQDRIGGTCLNRGCIPSKTLRKTADLLNAVRKAQEFGITIPPDVGLDMGRLMERKEQVIQIQAKGLNKLLSHYKIQIFKGRAHIKAKGLASIRQNRGDSVLVPWDKLILASGSQPSNIPAFPFDRKGIMSSDDALCLEQIPESMLIVGGGVIGCEFASIFSSFGAKATIVEALDRLLPIPAIDVDCSKVLQREMKKRKIAFHLNRSITSIKREGGKYHATLGSRPGAADPKIANYKPETIRVNKVLICIGRKPNIDALGLDIVHVPTDTRGWIPVNNRMETPIPNIYAVGDVLGPAKIMLAYVASAEGRVAAENALGEDASMDYDGVPTAVFTMPEVACVGLTQAQAVERGYSAKSGKVLFRTLGKPHVLGEIAGEVKLVFELETGKILGAHMVGPHVTELISEITLAVKTGATVSDLADTMHAHPTLAEVIFEVSLKALNKPLHG